MRPRVARSQAPSSPMIGIARIMSLTATELRGDIPGILFADA
jgi:hypothetical protein